MTCCLLAAGAGCAGSRSAHGAAVAARGTAPDDVARRPDPNAPYVVPAGSPHLVPRATALEARNAGPCDPGVLSVEEISGDSSGIFRSVKLAFMNRGATPCRLGGYPVVTLLDAQGQNIGSIATEKITSAEVVAELSQQPPSATAAPAAVVTLMPHEVAAFQVIWTTGQDCSTVSRILVSAPGTERTFVINQPMRICAGRIQVTALRLDEGDV